MVSLSSYNQYRNTSDADADAGNLDYGKIAYNLNGKIVGTRLAIDFNTDVSLLLHCDGVDASTTFTDDSSNVHVVTPNGDVQLDTADFKYGTAASLFDGSGDYLSVPYVAGDFDWFLEDFTLEFWIKAASWSGYQQESGHPVCIGRHSPTTITDYWGFGPINDGRLTFFYYNGEQQFIYSTNTVPLNEWVHVAMTHVYATGLIRLYVNGVNDGIALKAGTPQSVTGSLIIGQNGGVSMTGSLDDIRIIKGVVAYTDNFTPPTKAHADAP